MNTKQTKENILRLIQIVNKTTRIPDCNSYIAALFDLRPFLYWEIPIMLLFLFPLTFLWTQRKTLLFMAQPLIILVLIGPRRITLILVVLSLLSNFVREFKLELMYISLILNIRSSLVHLHGFQVLVQFSWFFETTSYICTNRINIICWGASSYLLVITAKGFLKLFLKLAYNTFGKLVIVLIKGEHATPVLFDGSEVLSSSSNQTNLLT